MQKEREKLEFKLYDKKINERSLLKSVKRYCAFNYHFSVAHLSWLHYYDSLTFLNSNDTHLLILLITFTALGLEP